MMMKRITLLFRLSRPILILGGGLQYALGLGLARYFGIPLHVAPVFLGLIIVWGVVLGGSFFFAQFERKPIQSAPDWLSSVWGGGDLVGDGKDQLRKELPLLLAFIALITAGVAFFYLNLLGWISPTLIVLMGLLVLGVLLYVLPPFQIAYSGFGEILLAMLSSFVIPAFSYVLVVGETHRFLVLVSVPIALLFLSVTLAVSFPFYLTAEKYGKKNLLIQLGWKQGFMFHNLFLFSAFLFLGLATLFDFPVRIVISTFLVLPLAALQIRYLNKIGEGGQPNWVALLGNSLVIYAGVLYLLTYSLWVG